MGLIYRLACPYTGEVRYVGQTKHENMARYKVHICAARNAHKYENRKYARVNKSLCEWINNLLSDGVEPRWTVLERCDNSSLSLKEALHYEIHNKTNRLLNRAKLHTAPRVSMERRDVLKKMLLDNKISQKKVAKISGISLSSVNTFLNGSDYISLDNSQVLSNFIESLVRG